LQAGQTAIECTARVSKGDNILTQVSSTGTNLTVVGSAATATFTPTSVASPTATFTSTPVESPTPTFTSTPIESATPTDTPTATLTSPPAESPTPPHLSSQQRLPQRLCPRPRLSPDRWSPANPLQSVCMMERIRWSPR
jgi:hypothetical protein